MNIKSEVSCQIRQQTNPLDLIKNQTQARFFQQPWKRVWVPVRNQIDSQVTIAVFNQLRAERQV